MATQQECLEILRKGVETWNAWRTANPTLTVDLSETDMSGVDFRGINFSRCNLERSVFTKTDLTGANFVEAYAPHAMFGGAYLSAARLCEGTFIQASFNHAF